MTYFKYRMIILYPIVFALIYFFGERILFLITLFVTNISIYFFIEHQKIFTNLKIFFYFEDLKSRQEYNNGYSHFFCIVDKTFKTWTMKNKNIFSL